MNNRRQSRWYAGFVVACVLTAAANAGELKVVSAWIKTPLPVQKTAALYFSLKNESQETIELIGVSVSVAKQAMFHQTLEESGMAKMKHHEHLSVPPGQSLIFRPGGFHVMLMGLQHPIKEGSQVDGKLLDHLKREIPFTATVKSEFNGE